MFNCFSKPVCAEVQSLSMSLSMSLGRDIFWRRGRLLRKRFLEGVSGVVFSQFWLPISQPVFSPISPGKKDESPRMSIFWINVYGKQPNDPFKVFIHSSRKATGKKMPLFF